MMTGVQFTEFQEALVSGFDSASLAELVRQRLGKRLDVIVGGGPFAKTVFDLIGWAERNGYEVELVRAAYQEVPRNLEVRRLYEKYGMAPRVSIQQAGAPVPGAPQVTTDEG